MLFSKGLWLMCVFGFLGAEAFCQTKVIDSLEQKLKSAHDRERVDVLNQLTYEFISVNTDKVIQYGDEALRLSRQIGYIKGEGIAYTYRGVHEYLSGQLQQAHKDLHHGLSLSAQVDDKINQGYTLLQLGNLSLEEVENDSALLFLQRSYEFFQDSTQPASLSKIYRNLSAVYGQRYQYDKQAVYLDRSIAIRRLLPDQTLLTDALTLKATNKWMMGDVPAAEALLDEALAIAIKHPEDEENLQDIHHLKSMVLFQQGRFDEAVALFDSARNYYLRTSLYRKYVTMLIDIGKVFSDRGEYELALDNLYVALELAKLRGYEVETHVIRTRIGWINFRLGDFKQAYRLANEALNYTTKRQPQADIANALNLKGVVLTDLNEFAHAKACLDSVILVYKQLGDNRGISEGLMNLGFLAEKQNRYAQALELYKESIRLAEASHYAYGLAWSNWGMGDIYFKQGNFKSAAQFLDRSEEYCRLIHAHEILIINYNTRRDLLAAQNRFKESLQFSVLASQLKDSIHRTDLARRFVTLEKMQEIEERDRDIKALQNDKQLAENKINLQQAQIRQQFILLIGGVISVALLGALALVYYRFYKRIKILHADITDKNKRIQTQADKLHEVNAELKHLYHEVSEQNEEIQAQASKLAASNKSISDLNRGLEQIVAQKTLELRTTNEELAKHNNELLQFSYTVSHNLRGPVARLLGLSDIVMAEQDFKEAQKWIALIGKTAADLDLIIKDLNKILDLRNEPHQYRETVELDKEWKQSISLLQDSLNGHEEITANFEALPQIATVRAMVQSTFYNLLSNAIKFRSPNRDLKVTATSSYVDGKARLEVRDNGMGFDIGVHKEKLFKLYKRFHNHVEGRGIGLYLVKSQIEILHGTIEVESVPGQGSRFTITLPLDDDPSHVMAS
jgi:signal transduction histidine kinase